MSIIIHTFGFVVFASLVLVLTQSVLVFPGALFSVLKRKSRKQSSLRRGVESVFITSSDGKRLEVWRLPAEESCERTSHIGIVFHGNAGTLENFFLMQLWFQEMGITSYSFDFRGFGKSSGWPSENGINCDSDAFWNYVIEREQIDPSRIIVCGFSVGAAPAARIASIHQPGLLVLVAAFTNLETMIRQSPLMRHLARCAWYKLPTIDYVRALERTSLLLLHGEQDRIVPPHHTAELEEAYRGTGTVSRITLSTANHNNVFYLARRELSEAVLRNCLDYHQN